MNGSARFSFKLLPAGSQLIKACLCGFTQKTADSQNKVRTLLTELQKKAKVRVVSASPSAIQNN
jgi:hypothetical protein